MKHWATVRISFIFICLLRYAASHSTLIRICVSFIIFYEVIGIGVGSATRNNRQTEMEGKKRMQQIECESNDKKLCAPKDRLVIVRAPSSTNVSQLDSIAKYSTYLRIYHHKCAKCKNHKTQADERRSREGMRQKKTETNFFNVMLL